MVLFGKKCEACGEKNDNAAKFCKGCGATFSGKQTTCPGCSAPLKADAKFCANCGRPMKDDTATCPKCSQPLRADAKFCNSCGQNLGEGIKIEQGVRKGGRVIWRREEGDFARRLQLSDFSGAVSSEGLVVEEGTNAILLVDGAVDGFVNPGRYTLDQISASKEGEGRNEGFLKRLLTLFKKPTPPSVTALLVDTSDSLVNLSCNELFTSDPIKTDLNLQVYLTIADPVKFLTNTLKGREGYPLSEAVRSVEEVLSAPAADFIRRYKFDELNAQAALQQEFCSALINSANLVLERSGLKLQQIRTLSFGQGAMHEVMDLRSEALAALAKGQAELEGERGSLELKGQRDSFELDKTSQSFDHERNLEDLTISDLEKRNSLYERLLRTENLNKMAECRSTEEMAAFLHDQDKEKMLRDADLTDLAVDLMEKAEDRVSQREHLQSVLGLQRTQELALLESKQAHALAMQDRGQRAEGQALDIELERNQRTGAKEFLKDDLDSADLIGDHERTQKTKDIQLENAAHAAQKSREELDLELAVKTGKSKIELENESATNAIELYKQWEEEKRKSAREARSHEQTMHGMNTDLEKSRIEADRDVGLAKAGADLRLIDHVKEGKSENQAIYERMVEEMRRSQDKMAEVSTNAFGAISGASQKREELIRQGSETADQMANRTMDRMSEVAVAKASTAGAPKAQGEAQAKVMVCPSCKRQVDSKSNFCEHCGNKIF